MLMDLRLSASTTLRNCQHRILECSEVWGRRWRTPSRALVQNGTIPPHWREQVGYLVLHFVYCHSAFAATQAIWGHILCIVNSSCIFTCCWLTLRPAWFLWLLRLHAVRCNFALLAFWSFHTALYFYFAIHAFLLTCCLWSRAKYGHILCMVTYCVWSHNDVVYSRMLFMETYCLCHMMCMLTCCVWSHAVYDHMVMLSTVTCCWCSYAAFFTCCL